MPCADNRSPLPRSTIHTFNFSSCSARGCFYLVKMATHTFAHSRRVLTFDFKVTTETQDSYFTLLAVIEIRG